MGLPADRFIFVRHCITDWNERGVFQGHSDIPLNETGISQARNAAKLLVSATPCCVISSPLQRAIRTAALIVETTGQELVIEPNLVECDFGSFEGMSITAAMKQHNVIRKEQLAEILPADAEQWSDLCNRSLETIRRCLEKFAPKPVIFVGHDAFLQSLAATLCGEWFSAGHGIPYEFRRHKDRWRVSQHH